MSKRKNRTSAPNIPQETLERARRQASGEDVDADAPKDFSYAETAERSRTRAERRAESGMSKRNRPPTPVTLTAAQMGTGRVRSTRKRDEYSIEEMDEMLNSPTKTVSVEQLRKDYGYVIADIRSMAILAGLLFLFIIVSGVLFG